LSSIIIILTVTITIIIIIIITIIIITTIIVIIIIIITIIIISLRENATSTAMGGSCSRVLVLPLFAMMTAEQQKKVFDEAPKGDEHYIYINIIY
jgi:hypothetical protein